MRNPRWNLPQTYINRLYPDGLRGWVGQGQSAHASDLHAMALAARCVARPLAFFTSSTRS